MPITSTSQAYDATPIMDWLDEQDISQETFAKQVGASVRNISRFLTGTPVGHATVEVICEAAGIHIDDLEVLNHDPRSESQCIEIERTLSCIAYRVLCEHQRVFDRYDLARDPGGQNIDGDDADPSWMDKHLAETCRTLLVDAVKNPDSPLHPGCTFVEEEFGIDTVGNGSSPRTPFYILADTNDDSAMSDAGLGGQGVFSALSDDGLLVSVVVDYARKRLFKATRYSKTQILQITNFDQQVDPARPTDQPEGRPLSVTTSNKTSPKQTKCKINLFLGKNDRVREAKGYMGDVLSDEWKVTLFPFGGGRGPCLVADGTCDCSLAPFRGMRHLDALPALLLVKQNGGVCLDLDTKQRYKFGPFPELIDALDRRDVQEFSKLRKRFVCAGTYKLAKAIMQRLP